MNIKYLDDSELRIELEIRALIKCTQQAITPLMRITLVERLQIESNHPLVIPLGPHESAAINPIFEAKLCQQLLQTIHDELTFHSHYLIPTPEEIQRLQTKILHIQGRLNRLTGLPVVKNMLPDLFKTYKVLNGLINGLSSPATTVFRSSATMFHTDNDITPVPSDEEDGVCATPPLAPGN